MYICIHDLETLSLKKTLFENIVISITKEDLKKVIDHYSIDDNNDDYHHVSEFVATYIFISRFGSHPYCQSCDCCGYDFSINIYPNILILEFYLDKIDKILFIPFDFEEFKKIHQKYSVADGIRSGSLQDSDQTKYKYFSLYEDFYETMFNHMSDVYDKYNIIYGEPKNYTPHAKDKILTQIEQIEIPTLYQQMLKMVAKNYDSSILERVLPEPLWIDYKEFNVYFISNKDN